MNIRLISAITLAALSIAAIGTAHAQVSPVQPPFQTYQQGCPPQVTPSAQVLYSRYMNRFAPLGLMPQKQQQIQSLVNGFASTHPAGSPLDPTAMHQLREQVRGVLTSQQLAMLQQQNHGQQMPHRCP